MFAIYKRELKSYFIGGIGYVFIAIFLAMSSLAFCLTTLKANSTDVSTYSIIMLFLFIILIPILTMKLFSEERKMRTEVLLLTSPITLVGMVLAKYLAALTLFLITMALSSLNIITLYIYAEPQTAIIVGNLIGITLVGAAFIAIGTFISALTENQLVAAVATIGAIIFLLVIGFVNAFIDVYAIRTVISWVSIFSSYQNFTYGIFDFAAALYYVSIIAVFLFLTVRVYEKRRWG